MRAVAMSCEEFESWFARPQNERTSVWLVGTGNSDRALLREGSSL